VRGIVNSEEKPQKEFVEPLVSLLGSEYQVHVRLAVRALRKHFRAGLAPAESMKGALEKACANKRNSIYERYIAKSLLDEILKPPEKEAAGGAGEGKGE
jgi:hypothetical protein